MDNENEDDEESNGEIGSDEEDYESGIFLKYIKRETE
jgi:hypothetical protein